ncbi:DUF3267 domain-containing protein [Planococcus maritimus]|uniref:DUF3267 domain-containing protein n=1 Tax=Planococcus maritimus TaxID=192421 RepID=UPI0007929C7F|nr:DUF3267 domain-containing protein [Planococcus maritimus]KYG60185.1 hypothetical protein AY633_08150 [Planococcus maritimus]
MEPHKIIDLNIEEIAPKALWFNIGLVVVFALAYQLFREPLSFSFSLFGILYFLGGYVLLIVLHELFHLIGFVVFGKVPLSSLQYGLNLKLGIAYATSDRPVKNRAMRAVLLLPFWMTAVLPSVIGFWAGDQVLVLLGAMLTAGAFGDFLMYRELRKEPNDAWILDDQNLPRLHVYSSYPSLDE